MDGLVSRLQERAARTPKGDWVAGRSYDDTLLAERRHPTRQDLDRASTEHPVVALHVSGHLAAVNSRGLEALGIGRDTPDPEGGRIRRDPATGEPDGVLEETAMGRLEELVLQPCSARCTAHGALRQRGLCGAGRHHGPGRLRAGGAPHALSPGSPASA